MTRRFRFLPAITAAFVLVVGSTFGAAVTPSSAAEADATNSEVTKKGTGDFSNLEVTVSQTRNLVDQVVRIDWSGGASTAPGSGQYSINYLQIMQCWSEPGQRPSREQCQYGGLVGDNRGGAFSASRQVTYGSTLIDPLETIKADPGSISDKFVPFRSVSGKVESGGLSEFFDANTTNEVPFGITRSNGRGQDFFSVQTLRDAPGLGCGEPIDIAGRVSGRGCWLVIVPRNDREVNGVRITSPNSVQLRSSPLSMTNWEKRIEFPLEFEPVGKPCPLGRAERLTVGHELVAEALTRWQPALCADGGPVFGYSQISDDLGRRQLASPEPALAFVSASDPGTEAQGLAPVAASAIVVGFNIERQSLVLADESIKQKDGERVTELRLTPRLVAKLLTQTYRRGADFRAPSVEGNPTDMVADPEFLALNPGFEDIVVSLPDVLMPAGRADIVKQVWQWLLADQDAKAFLNGDPDPWGTKINPAFRDVDLPRDNFPKPEPYCRSFDDGRPNLCTLDLHPYAADLGSGAKAASRGDTLARGVWDPLALPPAWKKGANQASGSRAVLTLTDAASAARFGLETAALRNASGTFVKPNAASIGSALKQFSRSGADGVRQPVARATGASYPLAALSYAAVPASSSVSARRDYAALLRYAAGEGQVPGRTPGTLPAGYVPLPKDLRTQTLALAASLTASAPQNPASGGAASGSTDPSSGDNPSAQAATVPGDVTAPTSGDGTTAPGELDATVSTASLVTPIEPAGAARLVPIAAALLALLCAGSGTLLIRFSRSGAVVRAAK